MLINLLRDEAPDPRGRRLRRVPPDVPQHRGLRRSTRPAAAPRRRRSSSARSTLTKDVLGALRHPDGPRHRRGTRRTTSSPPSPRRRTGAGVPRCWCAPVTGTRCSSSATRASRVLYPRKGVSELTRFTPRGGAGQVRPRARCSTRISRRWCGDPSDNLPGIPGGGGEDRLEVDQREYGDAGGSGRARVDEVQAARCRGRRCASTWPTVLRNRQLNGAWSATWSCPWQPADLALQRVGPRAGASTPCSTPWSSASCGTGCSPRSPLGGAGGRRGLRASTGTDPGARRAARVARQPTPGTAPSARVCHVLGSWAPRRTPTLTGLGLAAGDGQEPPTWIDGSELERRTTRPRSAEWLADAALPKAAARC